MTSVIGRRRGVKNWSKLLTDCTKKLWILERGCKKSGKIADIVYGWPLNFDTANCCRKRFQRQTKAWKTAFDSRKSGIWQISTCSFIQYFDSKNSLVLCMYVVFEKETDLLAASRSIWRFSLSGSCIRTDCGSIRLLVRTGRGSSRTLSGGLAWSLRTFWHRHIVAHLFVLWPGDRYSDLRKFKEIIFLTLYIYFFFITCLLGCLFWTIWHCCLEREIIHSLILIM